MAADSKKQHSRRQESNETAEKKAQRATETRPLKELSDAEAERLGDESREAAGDAASTAEKKAQFTPGPWRISHHVKDGVGDGMPMVASTTVTQTVACVYGAEREVNARLIAQAPAMYAALNELTQFGHRLVTCQQGAGPNACVCGLTRALRALAAVEGR